MKPQVIVCGLGQTGYKIFCLLRQQGVAVVGLHPQPLVNEVQDVVVGDPQSPETLLAAGIQNAHTLVLAGHDDALNLAILLRARLLNRHIRIVNRLFNNSLGDRLDQTLANHFSMSVSALAAPVFAFAALGNHAIGQLRLFEKTWPIYEEYIHANHPWRGQPLSQLWVDRSRMLIYYLPVNKAIDLVSAVDQGQPLQVGDRLIIATQPVARTIRRSLLQRFLKLLSSLRRFQEHSQATLGVILALLITIAIATVTYVAVSQGTSPIDALYFSVGMITGAGGQEEVAEQSPASIKVFTALMMLIGAGVIGICYALLNDFVLGTRFKQFWDVARVPQRHHFVVCGLGGIGVKTVNQLLSQGHEVVVIERSPNCRFLSTVRALKTPVIIGDASLPGVLKAANIRHADALLAVTDSDTANLEIALTAKGLAPALSVIVRNQDSQFAHMVQQVFEFEAVLSPTELAAPSFAAAALGGRILGSGMMANHLWVALGTMITPGHPFCGKRVKEMAEKADFVPLYLETKYQTLHGWDLLNTSLSAGDTLFLTIPAAKLEELWRVAPATPQSSPVATLVQ